MTDLDLLTGAIAARLRLLPEIARLYPTRGGLDAVAHSVAGLLDAVADDPAIAIRPVDDAYLIEASIGLAPAVPARAAAATVRAAIRQTCAVNDIRVHHVRVRIASID